MRLQNQKSTRWLARRLWLKLHLYVGLTLGAMLVVAGLTGSLIAFWQPLDSWLNPELSATREECGEAYPTVDTWYASAAQLLPPSGYFSLMTLPSTEQNLVTFEYRLPAPENDWDDRYQIFIDPCSATVVKIRLWETQRQPWAGPLMAAVMRIHTSLYLNRPGFWLGNYILSFGSALLMVSITAGLILWWPRNGRWRAAFTIKRHTSRERRNYDWHKTVGLVSAVLLLISLFTAIDMYQPWNGWINYTVKLFSGINVPAASIFISPPSDGAKLLSPGQAIAIAQTAVPSETLRSLNFPLEPQGFYAVNFSNDELWNNTAVIDPYRGDIVAVIQPRAGSAGDHFLAWLFPLHTGRAFGLAGRLTILVLGFAPAVLYVTGFIRWWQKRRAKAG